MSDLVKFDFRGSALDVVKDGERLYVSVRAACRALGIDDRTQRRHLQCQLWARGVIMTLPDSNGHPQGYFMLPHESVPMWLAGISPSKVRPEARPWLLEAQLHIAQVLADHFFPKPSPIERPNSLALLSNDKYATSVIRADLAAAAQAQCVSSRLLAGEIRRLHRVSSYLMMPLSDFFVVRDRLRRYIEGTAKFVRALPPQRRPADTRQLHLVGTE